MAVYQVQDKRGVWRIINTNKGGRDTMKCKCGSTQVVKFGFVYRVGGRVQRWICKTCCHVFTLGQSPS